MKGLVKMIIAGAVIIGIGIAVILVIGGITNWQYGNGDLGDYEMKTYEASADVENLSVNFSAGELKVVFGDVDKITVNYPESSRYTTKFTENGKNLSMTTGQKHWYDFLGWVKKFPETTITLPKSSEIALTFELNAGSASIEGGDFKNLSAKLNAGKLTIGDVTCANLTYHVNAGEISASGATCDRAVLRTNAGKLTVNELECPDIDAKVNAGSMIIRVDGVESEYTVRTEVNAGSCNYGNRTGTTDKRIEAEVNAGSLDISFTD